MSLSLISEPAPKPRTITKNEAIDIWIARWLNIRRTDLVRRYGCDPRRLYEIWEGKRFPASRDQALKVFEERYPGLMDRVDFGVPTSAYPRVARRPISWPYLRIRRLNSLLSKPPHRSMKVAISIP